MQTVGNYLKNGREAKNISLSEVARTTKISKWYLDCLEQDDFDKMPGGPYIKGYISSYAAYIGIEEDEVLKCYDSLHSNGTEDEQPPPEEPNVNKIRAVAKSIPNRKKSFILGLAILMLVVLGIYYFWPQNQRQTVADAKIQDSKGQQAADNDAPQTQNEISVSSKNQKYAHTAEQKDLHTNENPPAETKNLIQGPSSDEDQSAETSPSPKNHEVQPVPQKNSEIDGSGLESPVTVEQDAAPSSGLDSAVAAEQDAASFSGSAPTVGADQGSVSSGRATELSRSQPVDNIKVIEATACAGVANRSPNGAGDSFKWTTDKVYIWSWIESANYPTSVHHTYFFKGRKISDVELKIRSARWRTWSYKTISNKRFIGPWRVDITTAEGKLLQRIHFDVN